MDYKKKYEQALDNFKKIKAANKDNKELVNFIEYKYPELKESEDESVKAEIIAFIEQSIHRGGGTPIPQEQENRWLAWLGKQGKQKSTYKVEPKWKKGNDGESLYETSIVWIHNETKTLATAGLRLDSDTFYIPISELEKLPKEEFEKQGEQNNKHLYDVIIALWDLLDKIDTFSDLQIDDTNPDNPFKKIEYIAQERHKFVKSDGYNLYIQGEQITDFKQSKQKPAWSEEDEKMLKSVISSIRISRSSCEEDDDVRDLFDNEIDWLKSLKERMKGE